MYVCVCVCVCARVRACMQPLLCTFSAIAPWRCNCRFACNVGQSITCSSMSNKSRGKISLRWQEGGEERMWLQQEHRPSNLHFKYK